MVMAVMLRPKDEGVRLKILHLQLVIFCFGSEVGAAVGNFREGKSGGAWFAIILIPIWLAAYWLGLKLRRRAAQLSPIDLSNFLCHTILLGGVSAMAPMVFFTFESLSCTARNGLVSELCENTSAAATNLR